MTAAPAAPPRSLDVLTELVADGDVVVLSGAGLSTDSGIPDYRGATGSLRRHTPMTYQTFTRDPRGRHRYWARCSSPTATWSSCTEASTARCA